jgi:anthranilate/para-aminobenzoate synthase component I
MPRVSLSEAEPAERHVERVVAAKELIVRGDLYQVNLARRLHIALAAPPTTSETLTLFEHLLGTAPTPFGACLVFSDGIAALSTTPELMLAASVLDGSTRFDRLLTIPIKGTRARGAFAASDAALRAELEADPKERAELTMIIDVERNDLGRVARIGSVRVLGPPMISTLRTVHHREAQIVARVRSDASRREVLEAMLPSGSVTGAPKVRAMEVIASLEPCRRGLYTGALGSVSHDGSLSLAMAIRTVVLHGAEGEYLTGGGIVADSDPLRELEETRWKAVQVARLVGA